ncbi:hypothetical protein [Shimia marina]|uniref:Uncharacterized protein n=1 Tax=Shimia marina TaxID=321267 RepID=A0A0P1ENZ8_9RHOB|nr:hypothetical protein [Shimia marina]CUH51990.1 hypothetical protein SHM7688_01430 [Shimia marina]SFE78432.1 hypothetical protein SAMN04488037_12119 [Shimia marina]
MKLLSNYLNHLDFDLQEALLAKERVIELFEIRRAAYQRAEYHYSVAKEEFRDASVLMANLNQRIGELQSERFQFEEEWDDWKKPHQ